MKKDQKTVKTKEPITKETLLRRNPVPFGDVRKYYYVACVGTVVLLALCFHISVAAIALRTDTCVQIPNGIIAVLLICAVLAIIGHQTRTLAGYGLSAVCCLILILVMQLYNGGLALTSDLPEYGEVFRDGAKSTDFWILLAKVIAIVHLLLSVVFINSTLTVKEEPPLKGMNIKIQKIKDWIDKHNNSLPAGRRASDYWIYAVSMILYMVFVAYDPSMGKYDYYSLILFVAAGVLIACKQTLPGAMLMASSALIRCTLYQWRNGLMMPVVAAYAGLWLSMLYYLIETVNARKNASRRACKQSVYIVNDVFCWGAIVLLILAVPIHEFLNVFSGSYMFYQKDNMPLFLFIPGMLFLALFSKEIYGYIFGAVLCVWGWSSLENATPLRNGALFYFDSMEEHGAVGEWTTTCLMAITRFVSITSLFFAGVALLWGIGLFCILIRRRVHDGHGRKKEKMD